MTHPYNVPPPRPPGPDEPDRPLRPDSVEWWSPPISTTGPSGPIEPDHHRLLGRPNIPLHALLFGLTVLTTSLVGGPVYSATIVAILLAHEMGHYVMARIRRVPATLPYFIPVPLPPFGTMGAVIRMANVGADRRVLFDIGVAGPIAGLVLAIPACLIGIALSEVVAVPKVQEGFISLGSPILFQWFSDLIKGPLAEGYDIRLHPVAFAGWAGLFVTALNLLPVGQLDGGHASYALFGKKARPLSLAVALGFMALAIFYSREWILMASLLLIFGIRHPPTADDSVPIDTRRKIIAAALLILFVLCFTPRPFPN